MASPVSEEVHPDAIARIDARLDEIASEAAMLSMRRKRYAGPAYNAIEVNGFNVNARDTTKVKGLPNIKFPGTDAEYQEVLDKANATTMRKLLRKRTKLDVRIYELETKLRMASDLKIREMETRIFNLETLARYS